MTTLETLVESQMALVQEAAEAVPHSFNKCTYSLGSIRQAVYLCLTCAIPRGICAACSVSCHGDHEQTELFPKRNFTCDCPTSAIPHPCNLYAHLDPFPPNETNTYGQNYEDGARFCRCRRNYDPTVERETMVQCLACEDWFHESCLNLRTRPESNAPSPEPSGPSSPIRPATSSPARPQNASAGDADDQDDDDDDDGEDSTLPPALLPPSSYATLVCGSCVRKSATLSRWAGTKGVKMVYRSATSQPWIILDGGDEPENVAVDGDVEERPTKRARVESPCTAPAAVAKAQEILRASDPTLGAGDVFLTEGFRDRWCRCSSCLPKLEAERWLLEEEETYEPPADPDSTLSLEELGMRALSKVPREKAIEGIKMYNEMRDDLMEYLRPFAAEGRVVSEADVKAFFEARKAALAENGPG